MTKLPTAEWCLGGADADIDQAEICAAALLRNISEGE